MTRHLAYLLADRLLVADAWEIARDTDHIGTRPNLDPWIQSMDPVWLCIFVVCTKKSIFHIVFSAIWYMVVPIFFCCDSSFITHNRLRLSLHHGRLCVPHTRLGPCVRACPYWPLLSVSSIDANSAGSLRAGMPVYRPLPNYCQI